jgi:hypothetical protein
MIRFHSTIYTILAPQGELEPAARRLRLASRKAVQRKAETVEFEGPFPAPRGLAVALPQKPTRGKSGRLTLGPNRKTQGQLSELARLFPNPLTLSRYSIAIAAPEGRVS